MATEKSVTFLCLASDFKGEEFLREAKRQGARVLLITEEKLRDKAWPRESIDEIYFMPDLSRHEDVIHGVSYLARTQVIDRVIGLDDYDTRLASDLREHLRIPGMGSTTARYFRDKLSMHMKAEEAGLSVPRFVHVLNHQRVDDFMDRVRSPWVLKPRFEAGAVGIKKAYSRDEVWQAISELGDKQSYYLLEEFIPGDVYHVDSIVWEKEIVFIRAHKYGRPPLSVSHQGGVFMSRSLPFDGEEAQTLDQLTRQFITATGYVRGVAHTEYIRGEDGRFYFLETAARVGGANIADMIEAGSNVNLWREWARVEVANAQGKAYELPFLSRDYSGILICLAKQEWPDLSGYNAPEVVWRINKPYHAGLIVASPDANRVESLLQEYAQRFAQDFLAVGPQKEARRTA